MEDLTLKCPNCGANLTINKVKSIYKCEYCNYQIIHNHGYEDELFKLIEAAHTHMNLNDINSLRKDAKLLYEQYPSEPLTHYFALKADLMEIASLINQKQYIGRCNYLLSNSYSNLSRIRTFNKNNEIDEQELIDEYNNYVIINNKNMFYNILKIVLNNIFYISLFILTVCLTLLLVTSSLFFLGIILIFIEFFLNLPKKILKNIKRIPKKRKSIIFK